MACLAEAWEYKPGFSDDARVSGYGEGLAAPQVSSRLSKAAQSWPLYPGPLGRHSRLHSLFRVHAENVHQVITAWKGRTTLNSRIKFQLCEGPFRVNDQTVSVIEKQELR